METLSSLKCPDCGAALSIPEQDSQVKCTYCGSTFAYHAPKPSLNPNTIFYTSDGNNQMPAAPYNNQQAVLTDNFTTTHNWYLSAFTILILLPMAFVVFVIGGFFFGFDNSFGNVLAALLIFYVAVALPFDIIMYLIQSFYGDF